MYNGPGAALRREYHGAEAAPQGDEHEPSLAERFGDWLKERTDQPDQLGGRVVDGPSPYGVVNHSVPSLTPPSMDDPRIRPELRPLPRDTWDFSIPQDNQLDTREWGGRWREGGGINAFFQTPQPEGTEGMDDASDGPMRLGSQDIEQNPLWNDYLRDVERENWNPLRRTD